MIAAGAAACVETADLANAATAGPRATGPLACAHVTGAPDASWPYGDALAALAADGLAAVELLDPLDLRNGDARARLHAIAWLRDAASVGLPVTWRGDVPEDLTRLLVHLPPPDGAAYGAWRRSHRFLGCFWRRGPGFALVRDNRDPEAAARYTVDEPPMLRLVDRLAAPRAIDVMDDEERAALADLIDAGLAVEAAGWAVLLPYRMRRVPVPCSEL